MNFDIKRQKLSKSLWLKDLGDTIKINFLGKFFENIFMLDRLIHFHVVSAVVDFRLPCKWHAPLTAKLESWQWVILARRKQVLRYHVSTRSWCKQRLATLCCFICHVFVIRMLWVQIYSACSELGSTLTFHIMEKSLLKLWN